MSWSGTQLDVLTDGTEQTINAPSAAGTFTCTVDLTPMVDGDVIMVRSYKTIKTGGSPILRWEWPYYGAQHAPAAQIGPGLSNSIAAANALKFTIQRVQGTDHTYSTLTETI